MVILLQSSDSTGTLVSLNDAPLRKSLALYPSATPPPRSLSGGSSSKNSSSRNSSTTSLETEQEASACDEQGSSDSTIQLYPSALFLPDFDDGENDRENENRWYASDDDDKAMSDAGDSSSCYYSCSSEPRPLYLPLVRDTANGYDPHSDDNDEIAVDEYLPMEVLEAAEDLLSLPVQQFTSASRERILYVAQGEVAHAVPLQCDVLMSDRSTTCHIVALRSYSDCGIPLTSLAHVDDTCYEHCLRDVVRRHHEHHSSRCCGLQGSSKPSSSSSSSPSHNMDGDGPFIRMDVHVVGGFVDPTSRKISNFLIYCLATMAAEHYDDIKFTLQTCAISSLNGTEAPIGRGLAIDLRTGRPFLARADATLVPGLALRSARLFQRRSGGGSKRDSAGRRQQRRRQLACIHDQTSNDLVIQPFLYEPLFNADVLLSLDDDLLLRCTSTSPHCEEDDFCDSLRSTLQFLRDWPRPAAVFGKNVDQPVKFKRAGRTNQFRCLSQHGRPSMSSRLFG